MRKINLKMNEFLSMPPQTNQIAEVGISGTNYGIQMHVPDAEAAIFNPISRRILGWREKAQV